MKKTRVCELLGIDYPIIQGGMSLIANAELAAAVSNAGGLGIISPNGSEPDWGKVAENLRSQIRKGKSLTDKPFGVNFPIHVLGQDRSLLDIAIEEGIPVVTTGAGSPALHTSYLQEHGVRVLHLVASVKHAKGAEKSGVDAVIAEGYESGGINSPDELTTFVLVPQVVDAVSIPVIAAGGICDARGLVAALALGAEGVQMGTVFIATQECIADQDYKDAIVAANDTATIITGRGSMPIRGLKSELITQGQQIAETDIAPRQMICGAVAGMVDEIVSAGDVVRNIVEGYDRIVAGL